MQYTTKESAREVFKNRAVMNAIMSGLLLVIGSVIMIIGVSIGTSISNNPSFACPANDTNCASAKSLIGIVPIIAAAVMIMAGVWNLIPLGKGNEPGT